jgi:8-oxo-dGTP diphosphatase
MSVSGIIEHRQRVLLVKRKRDPFKGTWMFPSGFVDYGEHPEGALAREIREETGLEMTKATLLGVFQSPDDYREPGHIVFFYRVEVLMSEHLRTDPHENEAIDWFDPTDPPPVEWHIHKHFMRELATKD